MKSAHSMLFAATFVGLLHASVSQASSAEERKKSWDGHYTLSEQWGRETCAESVSIELRQEGAAESVKLSEFHAPHSQTPFVTDLIPKQETTSIEHTTTELGDINDHLVNKGTLSTHNTVIWQDNDTIEKREFVQFKPDWFSGLMFWSLPFDIQNTSITVLHDDDNTTRVAHRFWNMNGDPYGERTICTYTRSK